MLSTALSTSSILRRLDTTESNSTTMTDISLTNITCASASNESPFLATDSDILGLPQKQHSRKLVDGYGNEFNIPDFDINDIYKAIPKHFFQRSAAQGLYYVGRDIMSLTPTFYVTNRYLSPLYVPNTAVRTCLWAAYTFMQGLFGTGLWVLAHECGHQSFSPSRCLNDTVGWICHSVLLVPYFSWKISHSKHHKATGHMERDMVFVPKTREAYASRVGRLAHELHELTEETPIATALRMIGQQLFGWPLYLFTNTTGHNFHQNQRQGRGKGKKNGFLGGVDHFNPLSPLYEAEDAKLILLSDLGLAITGTILYILGTKFGWCNLLVWYGIPYLWINHWLVAITFLQHSDPSLPHYTPESWTYTRGAAATIDREFGFIGRQLLHGIIETHVLHHYVSTIPFYNAGEATEAIKKVMGRHYRSHTQGGAVGFLRSMWRSYRMCHWVEPNEGAAGEGAGVLFLRNRNGLGPQPMVMNL